MRGLRKGLSAPVSVRVRLAAGARLRAALNGHRVHRRFKRRGRRRVAKLAANDGLRFGRNRLVLTAFTVKGRYQRLRRSFTIRRDRPLVGAGRDRRALAGLPVRLDGTSTRRSHRRARLRLRWRIVDRPKGSKRARLREAGGARPRLITDVPGQYTVRLEADEVGRAARGRRAVSRASASSVSPTTADTVTLAAQPSVLPEGVPVRTIVSDTKPGIQLGSTFYPAWSQGWVQALVLDRDTLEKVSVNTYTAAGLEIESLAKALAKLSSENLVIVSGVGRFAPLESEAQKALGRALARIGAEFPEGVSTLQHGNFSVIGVPGTPPGTAHQCNLIYCWIHPGAVPGEIAGSLQYDINGNFAFNWPPTSYAYDTRAPGSSANQNVMQVSDEAGTLVSYPSEQMNGPAFQLLWLDSGTLGVRGNFTYSTSTGPDCGGDGCLPDLSTKLQEISNGSPPALIMLSSFGRPDVGEPQSVSWWGEVASLLSGCTGIPGYYNPGADFEACGESPSGGMGANQWAFLRLDGSGDYTLVGREGQTAAEGPNAGAELSEVITGKTARLAGLFTRNRQGLWEAGSSGNPEPVNPPSTFIPELFKILQQPPEPYPFPKTPAQWAAEEYIGKELDLAIDPKFGIRAAYWRTQSIDWNTTQSQLDSLGPCASSCPQGFNLAVFQRVKRELLEEIPEVAAVMNYMGNPKGELQGVLEGVYSLGAYDFVSTAAAIRELFEMPEERHPQGPNVEGIINGILTVASGAAGAIPVAGGLIAAPFTISRGIYMLTNALTNRSDGSSAMEPSGFGGDVYKWGTNLQAAAEASVDAIGLAAAQLVGDRGRLRTAAALARKDWAITTEGEHALQKAVTRSLGGYMWTTMLPLPSLLELCEEEPHHEVPPPGLMRTNTLRIHENGNRGFARLYFWPILAHGKIPKSTYETLFSRKEAAGNVNLYPIYTYAPAFYHADPSESEFVPYTPGLLPMSCESIYSPNYRP